MTDDETVCPDNNTHGRRRRLGSDGFDTVLFLSGMTCLTFMHSIHARQRETIHTDSQSRALHMLVRTAYARSAASGIGGVSPYTHTVTAIYTRRRWWCWCWCVESFIHAHADNRSLIGYVYRTQQHKAYNRKPKKKTLHSFIHVAWFVVFCLWICIWRSVVFVIVDTVTDAAVRFICVSVCSVCLTFLANCKNELCVTRNIVAEHTRHECIANLPMQFAQTEKYTCNPLYFWSQHFICHCWCLLLSRGKRIAYAYVFFFGQTRCMWTCNAAARTIQRPDIHVSGIDDVHHACTRATLSSISFELPTKTKGTTCIICTAYVVVVGELWRNRCQ